MKRVTGIGGIFFKSEDPNKLKEWYKRHLGIDSDQYGFVFKWQEGAKDGNGTTVWSPFAKDTDYYNPSKLEYMINYRVDNLVELLEILKKEGVQVVGEMEEFEYGKFGWIMDPEGRKIELWEPVDAPFL